MEPEPDRRFFIKSVFSREFVMDVEGRSKDPGARIILWNQKKDSDTKNQLFYFDNLNNRLRSALNHFCLDIKLAGKSRLINGLSFKLVTRNTKDLLFVTSAFFKVFV